MKTFVAFLKKEIIWQIRSARLLFLGILFFLLGIMNPAVAKLTPWLLDTLADSLAESGMTVTVTTVTALDSWMQFYKNIPLGLITFLLLESGTFTKEYETGTLILSLTKGLPRHQVVLSKALALITLWTAGYWTCFGITYGYNAYFWDNGIAKNLVFSAVCWWIFGIFAVSLTVLFSTLTRSNVGVLGGIGGTVLSCYLLSFLPHVGDYLPTILTDGATLVYGLANAETYISAIIVTAAASILCFAISVPVFDKKQL